MKVRGQHYVWRFYLEPWTTKGKIWCLRNGKIFCIDPKNVAKQRDFYRLKDLTDYDVWLVRRLAIDPSPPHLQPLHDDLLKSFALIPRLRSLADAAPDGSALTEEIDEAIINYEELLHGQIEAEALPLLKMLRQGDAAFYNTDDGAMSLTYYLCVQYMRTKKIRERMANAIEAAQQNGGPFDIDRIWNVLSQIFATNMGWSLYSDRRSYRLVLLDNKSNLSFIAGDQPLINTLGTKDGSPPNELEFYYPLTPTLAMLLTERADVYPDDRTYLTKPDVEAFNKMIAEASHEMLFADSKSALLSLAATT